MSCQFFLFLALWLLPGLGSDLLDGVAGSVCLQFERHAVLQVVDDVSVLVLRVDAEYRCSLAVLVEEYPLHRIHYCGLACVVRSHDLGERVVELYLSLTENSLEVLHGDGVEYDSHAATSFPLMSSKCPLTP